jgi:LacI family repressor for deo operon, udp, cdd, tsx, nupC, and nupG
MGITIRDVAEAAGVSTATVSRALRGLPNVDERTRRRVQQVAGDLDYVISPSASRLASGRTGSVAVVTPYIARWFFSTVLSGVEDVLQEADMDLLLTCIGDHNNRLNRSLIAPRLRRRVDGILVIAVPPSDPQLRKIIDLGMPTSTIGLTVAGVPSVTIDDVAAARLATQHLINLGHRRIGIIGGSPSEAPFTAEFDRETGFAQAMAAAEVRVDPLLEAFGYFTIEGGEAAMTALLTQPTPPTAVFALSDEMAFGALRALRSHGLRPGVDVSIVGVDGHDMAEHLELTTVVQPVAELGRIAAQALLVQMNDGAPIIEPTRVETKLVVRGSTGPAPGAVRD